MSLIKLTKGDTIYPRNEEEILAKLLDKIKTLGRDIVSCRLELEIYSQKVRKAIQR